MELLSRFSGLGRRFLRRDDGVVAAEFALISTAFLACLVGLYVVGIYFFPWNRLQYGTETAARYAAVHDDATSSDLEEIIVDSLTLVSADPSAITVTVSDTSQNGIDFREVTSTYQFSWTLPFIPDEMNNVQLASTARTPVN